MPDCIFCRIVWKEVPTDILFEDDDVLAFPDRSPKYPVHLLVIPKEHVPSAGEATPAHDAVVGKLLRIGAELAKKKGIGESGFRLVTNTGPDSGQEVHHLHVHVLGGERVRPL